MHKRLYLPASKRELLQLNAGDTVLLSGIVYTARDAAHMRLIDMINRQIPLPFPTENAAIYYVGPTPPLSGCAMGSAGPTTASRCDPYTPALLKAGVSVLIGKGKRSQNVVGALSEHGAVYLAAIGGAGAMLSKCIKTAKVIAFDDLGTEAIRELYIEDFPAVVINDVNGFDYYELARQNYLKSI